MFKSMRFISPGIKGPHEVKHFFCIEAYNAKSDKQLQALIVLQHKLLANVRLHRGTVCLRVFEAISIMIWEPTWNWLATDSPQNLELAVAAQLDPLSYLWLVAAHFF